ncbi:hypothetical protein Taro_010630 [Colocasia esculenta]|uniref:Trichome birefringence-like N-terminal domain-containing protein n=1 Tax=Colocasia esculenta TaxID=4460 RepID=A0A843U888_COLES|nr:hypothetical protein [Colocasia esculenta]
MSAAAASLLQLMGLYSGTTPSPPPWQHHMHLCYYLDHHHHPQQDAAGVASKVWFSLLMWVLGVASVVLLSISYSPNPFGAIPLFDENTSATLPGPGAVHSFSSSSSGDGGYAGGDVKVDRPCDLSVGKWVRDEQRPAYTNRSCRTTLLPQHSRDHYVCGEDMDHAKWRWKPDGCELPGFDARSFLGTVRGKKLAFVGDRLAARSQMESLRCLLSEVELPEEVQRNVTGEGLQEWYYPSHDFTLMIIFTRFLVMAEERIHNGSASGVFDVQLDKVDMSWASKLEGLDCIVISSDLWSFKKKILYLYEGGSPAGCVSCSDPSVRDLGNVHPTQRALGTALQYIGRCSKCDRLLTILRTVSPAHLEINGTGASVGHCNHSRMPLDGMDLDLAGADHYWELRLAQLAELSRAREQVMLGKGAPALFGALDVTRAMLMRTAGNNPSSHWKNGRIMKGYNGCLNWCLPGPIDMWNDMLLAVLGGFHISQGR